MLTKMSTNIYKFTSGNVNHRIKPSAEQHGEVISVSLPVGLPLKYVESQKDEKKSDHLRRQGVRKKQ